jgi:ribonucleoside-diphosphate reductase alpha chain
MKTEEDSPEEAALAYFNNDALAAQVWTNKYALRTKAGELKEFSPDDMHRRLAGEFARIERAYSDTSKIPKTNPLTEAKIYAQLKGFKKIVPQGSPMMGIGNHHINTSLSNCVVVESPEDNISSIMNSGRSLANLFKRRCGVGLDLSSLRPEGTRVSNSAGTTTGAWSFADYYSHVCRMIGQNGRRGALMLSLDIRHPDIEKFALMKNDLTKVTGANVSIKVTDSFMEAVKEKQTFTLQFPVDSKSPVYTKEISAVELWEKIIISAQTTAEPGLLMWDNITKYLPANNYPDFKTISTNPCAEIPLSAYDSCRLISINLKNFVTDAFSPNAKFDYDEFTETVRCAMRMSDNLVELELEKLQGLIDISDAEDEKQLWKKLYSACKNGRRTGLGTHGLADALANLNLTYGSPNSLKAINKIYSLLKTEAYKESVQLARERGSFPAFHWEIEKNNLYIKSLPQELQAEIKKHGRRNISILTNAPTGSVSLLSQTSSGLEPVFRNSYIRRRKLEPNASESVDFIDPLGDKWHDFEVFHHNAQEWKDLHPNQPLPDLFIESQDISWRARLNVQAEIQQHIDHAISSTINLPAGTSGATVSNIYMTAWEKQLKGVTVYVDGSRSGVLITKRKEDNFPQHPAPKRPEDLNCDIHLTKIQNEPWLILVGLLDEKPYEIFGGKANLIDFPKKYKTGKIKKRNFKSKNGKYDLHIDDADLVFKDIVTLFNNPNNLAFARMVSLGLRHGTKVKFMVEQLQKDKNSSMFSFSRCISRILKQYIQDGAIPSDKICKSCNSDSLIYQDGCVACTNCGAGECD